MFDVPTALPTTLDGFRQSWYNPNLEQKILVDRRSPKLLRDIFLNMSRFFFIFLSMSHFKYVEAFLIELKSSIRKASTYEQHLM